MITYFQSKNNNVFATVTNTTLSQDDALKLQWAFGDAEVVGSSLEGIYSGPRPNMITPWSTNAVEIMQNMGIEGIIRIEEFIPISSQDSVDPMLLKKYNGLDQHTFTLAITPEPIQAITDIAAYNAKEGLALSDEEITYLEQLASRLGRALTDSEVFGFSQVNSEHCRHKIFNGTFVINGVEQEKSLFKMIKETSKENPNGIVSAYKDNVAFVAGPEVSNFAPQHCDQPSIYEVKKWDSVLSLKAETHNFPTTVEPFNGAATGSGGEIRDRLAGGIGSIPLAGTAVYMTAYPRLKEGIAHEDNVPIRPWLYQSPLDILIKASNGASDFGNKFGQPLIAGSVFTFEHREHDATIGYDKVIMQAGGIGFGKLSQALKSTPNEDDAIVVLGGDNYRIGMGGAAVSSADTGEFASGIELNAVQRSNPEMQKRVANTIVALVESDINPIVSIHDHGAGGHLNCLSELVEPKGGIIHLDKLPVGDPTLSAKEIIGNESQERMGLVVNKAHLAQIKKVADRERAPMYVVGEVSGDGAFHFESETTGAKPIDLQLSDMFGSSPKMIMTDERNQKQYADPTINDNQLDAYIKQVLRLESVACKDWLTNKVDRCVGGKVAMQQCAGPLQLPLNNCAIMALDFYSTNGIATSIGHAPIAALIDPAKGSRLAIAECLTNLVWAPLKDGIKSVSLSANWMWPCKNPGEDTRLYDAVQAAADFAIGLGINIPTGKDSLSMKQKYPNNDTVIAPGTVIISGAGHTNDFTKAVSPVLQPIEGSNIYYISLSSEGYHLGGSALYQTLSAVGSKVNDACSPVYFKQVFDGVQTLINAGHIMAGHDIGSGGTITSLLEMCFAQVGWGMHLDLSQMEDLTPFLFCEKPALIVQGKANLAEALDALDIRYMTLGNVKAEDKLTIKTKEDASLALSVSQLRDEWYATSYYLDKQQTKEPLATARFNSYKHSALEYQFPTEWKIEAPQIHITQRPKAAIIREKGSNSEREMANALHQSGFEVWDVHMTDLINGRIDFSEVRFLGAVGGFSNSDVLGSAKGWAGAFKYNDKAKTALEDFFKREDTLSIGICNGCQLFMELDLIYPEHAQGGRLVHNDSHKHESIFTSVHIQDNNSVMLKELAGCTLGVWVSHGEGKFSLPYAEDQYHIVGKYGYANYPANPNGSMYNTAMMSSHDGRHLVTMPHIERSYFGWNWPYYPAEFSKKGRSPWSVAFDRAWEWMK